jgi:sugar lactone lactonase YvrE
LSRRARRASAAFLIGAALVVTGYGAVPADASLPLTYDHIAGLPRHLAPESVAVDASGDVYVTDTNGSNTSTDDRLVKYDADGTFLDVIAGPGTAAGSLVNPTSVAVAPNGDIYVIESGSSVSGGTNRVSYFDNGGTYLGGWGTSGSCTGCFTAPQGIAVDSTGDVYVADTTNGRIQKFDAGGAWLATWDMSLSSLNNPVEVAVDDSDRVWVVDNGHVARFSTGGVLQTSWTSTGATGIDVGSSVWVSGSNVVREFSTGGTLVKTYGAGELASPQGVSVAGNELYVADTGNSRIVRYGLPPTSISWTQTGATGVAVSGSTVYAADGTDVQTSDTSGTAGVSWGSSGSYAVTVDGGGDIWVSSMADNVVRRYDASGSLLDTIGSGVLSSPKGIAVDSGKLYVADTGNDRIVRFTTAGVQETQWASVGVTGLAVSGSTVYAANGTAIRTTTTSGTSGTNWVTSSGSVDVAVDGAGNIWTSSSSGVVREYNSSKTLVATIGSGLLSSPVGIALAGNRLFVADPGLGKIVRFTFASLDTAWGEYGPGVEDSPAGVATDASDNVYVTNKADDLIQKYDASGAFLDDWGGSGIGLGQLDDPSAIAVSPSGTVYVADTANSRIQPFAADGTPATPFGSYGSNASAGQMINPSGIAVNASGDVYVADFGNNRIIKFGPTGAYLTHWGGPLSGSGNGSFFEPRGIAIDGSGNVWVADSRNNRIQEFTSNGTFITKWGGSGPNGTSSSSQDGGFNRPYDLDIDAEGTVWVADRSNDRIQRLSTSGAFLSKLGSHGLDTYQFDSPSGLTIDSSGRVLVADTSNDRVQVFVDQNGPDTTFTNGPATATSETDATFTFTANEPGATFECHVDVGVFAPCSSGDTFGGNAEGSHTMYVQATDTDGNQGNPATYEWTVDLTPPTVAIDSTPADPTSSTNANFTYHSSEPQNATYVCSLDGSAPASCSSSYSGTVADGDHTFDVWSIDQAGNQSADPSEYTWTVDTTPPVVHINNGPSGYVSSTNAQFAFDSPDGGATFECHIDGLAFAACTSPASYNSLSAGLHTFYVRAIDTLGNVSAAKTQTWTVDLADHRPDAWVGVGGKYIGNGVYNSTGSNQTKTIKTSAGKTVSFGIKIENDGNDTDSYTVQGRGPAKGYTVTYFVGTSNLTTKITNGNYTFSIAAGSSKSISMKVAVKSSGKASYSSLVTVTSGHEPSKVDAVKAIVKRV